MKAKEIAPGLRIVRVLPADGQPFRCIHISDERVDSSHGQMRILYLFQRFKEFSWRNKFLDRLHQLRSSPLFHVSRPLEVGRLNQDQLFIITDWYDHVLEAEIGDNGLPDDSSKERARSLFGQVVRGLAELHARGIVHGNIWPGSVHLDKMGPTASIGGTAWGPLRSWTNGEFLASVPERYFAPENRESTKQSLSFKSDVYSVGRIGLELFQGRRAENRDIALLPRRERSIIRSMLSDRPENRPDAADVCKKLTEARTTRLVLGGIVFIGLASLLAGAIYASKESTIRELRGEIAKLQEGPVKPDLDPDGDEKDADSSSMDAKSLWSKWVENSELGVKALNDEIESLNDEKAKDELNVWLGEFKSPPEHPRWYVFIKDEEGNNAKLYFPVLNGDTPDPEDDGSFGFDWNPGQPINIQIVRDEPWYSTSNDYPVHIRTFKGPVSVWLMHTHEFYHEETKLRLEVYECPGPPKGSAREQSLEEAFMERIPEITKLP